MSPQEAAIHLINHKCLQHIIRRKCMLCFYPGVSTSVAERFKFFAYKLVKPTTVSESFAASLPLSPYLNTSSVADKPIVVLLAHRGPTASRHIDNIAFLIDFLTQELTVERGFELRVKNTSDHYATFQQQIALVATAQVVIAEHGAFQSNLVYMRRGSLLLDLRGTYRHGEFLNFEKMARMFGVFMAHVFTTKIETHRDDKFNITAQECSEIVSIVTQYKDEAPYKHIY